MGLELAQSKSVPASFQPSYLEGTPYLLGVAAFQGSRMHAPLRIAGSHSGWRLFPGPLGKSQTVNGNLVPLHRGQKTA